MKFEVFSGKFQNAINVLSMYGRAMHNEDIVDLLWPKIQSADLAMFLSSLKVDYRRNRQVYTDILQELAMQIPVSATQPFSPTSVSDIHRVDERNKLIWQTEPFTSVPTPTSSGTVRKLWSIMKKSVLSANKEEAEEPTKASR